MTSEFAFLDHPRPLPFAHRGGTVDGLENTMAAFQRAVELGFTYLETDVRVTADGVLLAFHDETLDRATDRRGRVPALPYAEVAKARIGGREPIPLLEELLGAWPGIRVNVDVKEAAAIPPLVRVLRRTGAGQRVCVASFSQRRLGMARALLGPRVCTAAGPGEVLRLRLASCGRALARLARDDVPCVQVPPEVRGVPLITPAFVSCVHELGLQVHAWTINERDEATRLLGMGVDGIMTDDPDMLHATLTDSGRWVSGSPE